METTHQNKISFCIICMNRTLHLKETLPNNIMVNAGYDNLEIILLDYNSSDDMEEWAKNNLAGFIAKKRITYYKTFQPVVFSHSHSKNLAFKLAEGDIVGNINADNFVGSGFADYINSIFRKYDNVFMSPNFQMGFGSGTAGTVCVRKKDFLNIGGFDETMLIYGWEDVDFNNRLQYAGIKKIPINDTNILKCIDHEEKYDNNKLLSKIHSIYVNHHNPADVPNVKLLILFNDLTYKTGTIVNNVRKAQTDSDYARRYEARKYRFQFELEEVYWTEGYWKEGVPDLVLSDNKQDSIQTFQKLLLNNWKALKNEQEQVVYYHVTDRDMLNKIAYFEMDYNNRLVMLDNCEKKKIVVNNGIFGQSTVYRNFNYETAIPVL